MVLATALFACMGVCVKQASLQFSTAAVVSARGGVGGIMMLLIAWHTNSSLRTRVPLLHIKRGLAGALALSLWFYSISHLPLATAVTLNYMSSVWMAVYLLIRFRLGRSRHFATKQIFSIAIGFLGVGLVLQPTISSNQILAGVIGSASGILAAAAYIQVTALGRAGEPETRVVFYFSLISTLVGFLIWLLPNQAPTHAINRIPTQSWIYLLGTGIFATLAQLLMTQAYARGNMLTNASLQYLGIVHAALLGVFLFGETLTLASITGMTLIVFAGILAKRTQIKPPAS